VDEINSIKVVTEIVRIARVKIPEILIEVVEEMIDHQEENLDQEAVIVIVVAVVVVVVVEEEVIEGNPLEGVIEKEVEV